MSSLINDLNSIYEIKQQIKEVAYIESDIFAEYPAYIAEAIQSGGATGTTTITGNGTYNVATYQYAYVDVPQQEVPVVPPGYTYVDGYTTIIANGEYDVATYAYAYIDVPAPEGWVLPTGTAFITTNGEFDIHLYESAYVTVPQDGIDWDEVASYGYIVPAGTYDVTENGTFYTAAYAYTYVSVSGGGITPEGNYMTDMTDWTTYIIGEGTSRFVNLVSPDVSSYETVTLFLDYMSSDNAIEITQNGLIDVKPLENYNYNTYLMIDVPQGGGLPTYEFEGGFEYANGNFTGQIKYYQLINYGAETIANVLTEDWWTYAFPTSGYMINDPAFNDPTHKLYVMNDDVKNECIWQVFDYDYQNLPDWNTAHLAKESYNYYKGVVTFIPEYNRQSFEVVPYGMNKRYNNFSYVGLCAYGTSWSQQNTLFNIGAYMPLKKDSNVINNENQAYWLTSQKVTYNSNAGTWDGSYISSFFGSSWNAIIDKDGYIRDIVSKVGDTNAYQAKWGSDDTVTTTSNDISITGYITEQNYGDYLSGVGNNKFLYLNFDNISSYSSNQPYIFKYGFYPNFSLDIDTSGITSYSTSKQVELYGGSGSAVFDNDFTSNIVNNYAEFTFEYTLTIPKRFFMDPENNPATLDYTFTGSGEPTPITPENVTNFQTAIGTSWYTGNRVSGTNSDGSWSTTVTKSNKATSNLETYKIYEINVTGETSGTLYFVPDLNSPDSLDINNLSGGVDVALVAREDQNGKQMFTLDTTGLPANANLEVSISVPDGVLDPDDSYYMQCHIDYTITY